MICSNPCETCVQAMREGFNNPSTEGILLVDASNAFNSVNRKAALHKIRRLCPALATFASNTHTDRVRLFVTGSGELHSTEGTCQGDPSPWPSTPWPLPRLPAAWLIRTQTPSSCGMQMMMLPLGGCSVSAATGTRSQLLDDSMTTFQMLKRLC